VRQKEAFASEKHPKRWRQAIHGEETRVRGVEAGRGGQAALIKIRNV
jgi:hypothetical protein